MKVEYLGTAAAERIPGMFCNCETCRRALARGGKNIMTHAQVLIDDKLLVDFSGDTYMHFMQEKRTLWDIEAILITHSHPDHFTFESFLCRAERVAYDVAVERMPVYTTEQVIGELWQSIALRGLSAERIGQRFEFIPVEPYQSFRVGAYTVTPLPASHTAREQALLYLIERDGRAMFYGNDTGEVTEEIVTWLAENRKKVNLLSLDCTKGDTLASYKSHMSMVQGREVADRFLKAGITDENTRLFYTHFSHNCGMIYDELVVAAQKYGFEVTYDGLTLEV